MRGSIGLLTMVALVIGLAMGPGLAAEADPKKTRPGARSYKRGIKQMQKGRYEKAMASFQRALPHYQGSSDILYYLTRIAHVRKMWREAVFYGSGFLYLERAAKEARMVKNIVAGAKKTLAKKKVLPVEVKLAINPKGIEVRANHVPVGLTQGPTVPLYPGTYTFRCKDANHYPWSKVVVIKEGESTQTVTGTMRRVLRTGMLAIKTKPAKGVTVYIDNKRIGLTPLKPIKLRTGKYLVRFEKKGWDRWHRYIFIENERTTKLQPVMERTPPGKSPYRME